MTNAAGGPPQDSGHEQLLTVPVTTMAHGGHAVGRVDGQVVFVRHAIPGETVTARVTGQGRKGRYLTADAVEVLTASSDRVSPPCPVAAECGGCDFQHISLSRQRELKATVLSEQLQRLGGVEMAVPVLAADDSGTGWRTRMRFVADDDGRWGLRRHGSHAVVPLQHCVIATENVNAALADAPAGIPGSELVVVDQPDGAVTQLVPGGDPVSVVAQAGGRRWQVAATGFWQTHRAAAQTLVAAVGPHVAGADSWWDLYCGVGLFAGSLAADGQNVTGVEGDRRAARLARRNLRDLPNVRIEAADVGPWVAAHGSSRSATDQPDVIVLDPPRRGAGRAVVTGLTQTTATKLVYVACDPAALGRDVGYLREDGWTVAAVTGFDLFPMTHHVEAVAVLSR